MSKKWKILEQSTIFKNQWFEIREHKVQVSDELALEGVIVLDFPNWVNVVAMDTKGQIILEKNYRHGHGEFCIETPSGTCEPTDVSPKEAGRRELLEETGYAAGEMIPLGKSLANAQLQNNWIHHFLALDCQLVQSPQPEFEGSIESWTEAPDKVMARLEKGEISNSYIVEGLLRAERYLKRKS